MYYKGFNEKGFVEYIKTKYTTDNMALAVIQSIIDYAQKTHHVAKGQFVNFISDLIPFIDIIEILPFCEDDILTDYYIKRKKGLL